MKNYAYAVVEMTVYDYLNSINVWVFETLDKAKSFLSTRKADLNQAYGFYDNGCVLDENNMLFSWTLNLGFNDNCYDIRIERKEVL